MAYGSPANTDASQNIDKHTESTLECAMHHNMNNYWQQIDSNYLFISIFSKINP